MNTNNRTRAVLFAIGAVALAVIGSISLAASTAYASGDETPEICQDILGCEGGTAHCADYSIEVNGGPWRITGTCTGQVAET